LLLTQPVLLIMLFLALPPPELHLLRAHHPLLLSLLSGAVGCPSPRHWQV
jgi:hypothetical protein